MNETADLPPSPPETNGQARSLARELDWLTTVLDARLKSHFSDGGPRATPLDIPPPSLEGDRSAWAELIRRYDIKPPARLILVLALTPHLKPQLLDVLWAKNEVTERGFTEFGGVASSGFGGFLPTGETAAFVLSGDDLEARFEVMRLLDSDGLLVREGLLRLGPTATVTDPRLSGALLVAPDWLDRLTVGVVRRPAFSPEFPARRIDTERTWRDLVLPSATLSELDEIRRWVLHSRALLHDWGMMHKLHPGFTCLFHGPPGTGKTLAASLLGKHCSREVYKVDLSMIVSKYIGETEKNLARVFDAAERRGWILFFDEADALFGKRTRVADAHDRYANQEVSFLLQRIEEYDGVVILASNLRSNIDDAFLRRFHSVIPFAMPRPPERLRLWREGFSSKSRVEDLVDLARIADKYEMAGGAIMNVVRYCSLLALSRGDSTILLRDIEEGIRRELLKEGRAL